LSFDIVGSRAKITTDIMMSGRVSRAKECFKGVSALESKHFSNTPRNLETVQDKAPMYLSIGH